MPAGTLTRQRTNVGRGKFNRNSGKSKIPKKTMMASRAPLVETKSKTREDLVQHFMPRPIAGLHDTMIFNSIGRHQLFHMNPLTYFVHVQGLDEHQIIGKAVTTKYLKQKISVRFPQIGFSAAGVAKVVPIVPQRYELVWGWVPVPLAKTGSTYPVAPDVSINIMNDHINDRVKDYLDERKDQLRYIPKQASSIRIVGRRRVKPNLNELSTAPLTTIDSTTGDDYAVGSLPMYHTSINWKCNGRKLNLEKGVSMAGGTGAFGDILYPNYSWLPFCVFNIIDYETLPGEPGTPRMPHCPAVAYNDILYYTDS